MKHLTLSTLLLTLSTAAFAQVDPNLSTVAFAKVDPNLSTVALAKVELTAMLQGTQPVDFERAVYLSEAPFRDSAFTYEVFQHAIDQHEAMVRQLAQAADGRDTMDFNVYVNKHGILPVDKLRYTPDEKEAFYARTLLNWAIFTWLTDTVQVGPFAHHPFEYSTSDPFGKQDWNHTHVTNLLLGQPGNCYALTALYKILANRLDTKAQLATAPQHIFIRHVDTEGRAFNVELATAGFPTDGKLQTLTHSPTQSIQSGIALRTYTDRQAIGLCLVNLAKAYEHQASRLRSMSDAPSIEEKKMMSVRVAAESSISRTGRVAANGSVSRPTPPDKSEIAAFQLQTATLVLAHDPNNLNALLLKHQVLNQTLLKEMAANQWNSLEQARQATSFKALKEHLAHLHQLGYRPMPLEMQRIILQGIQSPEDLAYYKKDKNPSPFTSITPLDPDDAKYVSLSGGLFQEVFSPTESVTYGNFTFDPVQQAITEYIPERGAQELIDPVAFAYNFGARMYDARLGRWMSRDPMDVKYPEYSPYNYTLNNPILYFDLGGNDVHLYISKNPVGTAKIRLIGSEDVEGAPETVNVDVYELLVTDDVTGTTSVYHVTRDGFVINSADPIDEDLFSEDEYNVLNTAFEPKEDVGEYDLIPTSTAGLGAYALRNKEGGADLEAEDTPRRTGDANGVMIHVGGKYTKNGKEYRTGSLGCFTLCGKDQGNQGITNLVNDINKRKEANRKANAGTNIELIIEKREDVDWKLTTDENGDLEYD